MIMNSILFNRHLYFQVMLYFYKLFHLYLIIFELFHLNERSTFSPAELAVMRKIILIKSFIFKYFKLDKLPHLINFFGHFQKYDQLFQIICFITFKNNIPIIPSST